MTDSPGRPGPGKPGQQAGGYPLTASDPATIEQRDVQAMTRIVLRPIGSPLPLGFFTVAIDNVLVSTLQWGLAVAAPRFLIAGVGDLTGNQAVSQAGAVLGFLLAAVAMYTASALLMEDSHGREVLPIGRTGSAREATHGNLAVELQGIERQPGVRRTL